MLYIMLILISINLMLLQQRNIVFKIKIFKIFNFKILKLEKYVEY